MPSLYSVESIIAYLRTEGYVVVDQSENFITVEVVIGGTSHLLRGQFPDSFPLDLPKFYLLDRKSYGRLAHVGWRQPSEEDIGLICEGIAISRSINYQSPEQVFVFGLEAAVETLKDPLSCAQTNDTEIQAEFAGHWSFSCTSSNNRNVAIFEPDNDVKQLLIFNYNPQTRIFCLREPEVNPDYLLQQDRKNTGLSHKGIYIPLEKAILPPAPDQPISEWWWNEACPNIGQDAHDALLSYIQKNTHQTKKFSVIFKVPLEGAKFSLAGFDLTSNKRGVLPILSNRSTQWSFEPFLVESHSSSFLIPRGGANKDFSTDSILIVGCGSVGGEIARQLAYSGLGRIDLLDFDTFEIPNIYRHVLPSEFIGVKKTEALKFHLQRQFPYLDMEVIDQYRDLLSLANSENLAAFLNKYDGVVIATGDATQDRYFNNKVAELNSRPWIIYSWLEGYGVGGHAIYVAQDFSGCLSCLFRDPNTGEPSLNNIQNFLCVEQSFAVDISGCGTHFLPYGFVDVVQTATLTVRMLSKAIEGKLGQSSRSSWKGDGEEALDSGLNLTRRFYNNQSMDNLPLKWDRCPVCGGEDDGNF